ncbi:unnamed protein product [Darwinula stevensoni]|uniref:Kringle domain-containing protein n=1 Tax=Darwinula stevensoni TaxID=69355 RepID=A0A7R9A3W2_9CRUS|nr:unnamed protein product [Darwinula stevensoni]CAG0891372.1 unnamed protein product [Darwinula stevensoni]
MATCASMRPDAWCTTFTDKQAITLCPPPLSCLSEHPKMENMTMNVTYKDWDGKYPAPPGATVIFSCPARFNDGSFEHNATCSLLRDHVWNTSFQDKDVRCPRAVYPQCRLSESGKEYIGTTNVTETGKSCLRWDSEQVTSSYDSLDAGFTDILAYEEHFLNQDPSWHKNFCRNPTTMSRPWCFVDDYGVKMEFCRILLCDDLSVPECKLSQKGGEYVGVKNRTISGFACEPWLDPDSNGVDRMSGAREGSFPDKITDSHKFCRNPIGYPGGPWCSVKDPRRPTLNWEYCDVPFCDFSGGSIESRDQYESKPRECIQTDGGREYLGLKNMTMTGKKCQPWLSQTPNAHSTILYLPAFPDPGMDSHHNYCRNPYYEKSGPWCYNGESTDPNWEYCDIQLC